MKITHTFEQGKMYSGNGRWAKVMTTKCIGTLSVAFGREGEFRAHTVWDNKSEPTLTRKEADLEARDYILHG